MAKNSRKINAESNQNMNRKKTYEKSRKGRLNGTNFDAKIDPKSQKCWKLSCQKLMLNLAARKNGIGVKMAAKTVVGHGHVAGVPRPGGSKG